MAEPRQLWCQFECVECGAEWERTAATRWRAYLTDDPVPKVVLYCFVCATREFGEH